MSFSFEILNSVDLFYVFSKTVEEYLAEPLSSGKAVVSAMLGWHVADWVYNEYPDVESEHGSKGAFQEFVKSQCPSLDYLQDVANGTKHKAITKYTPTVRNTEIHHGAFSSGFSKGFDIPCLKLTVAAGTVVYFDEEITKARDFWRHYFNSILGVCV